MGPFRPSRGASRRGGEPTNPPFSDKPVTSVDKTLSPAGQETRTDLHPCSALGGTRTHNLLIRRPRLVGPCRPMRCHLVANEQVGMGVELGEAYAVRRPEMPRDPIVG